jgi:hypothetical protein
VFENEATENLMLGISYDLEQIVLTDVKDKFILEAINGEY